MIRNTMIPVMVMVVVVCMTGTAWADEVQYWVHPQDGDDDYDGTKQYPFRTIEHAVEEECTGDDDYVIHVQNGSADPGEPDYVEDPIVFGCDNVELIFEEGVVVEANIEFGLNDCLFEADGKSDIILKGEGTGATLQMLKDQYISGGQRHVISLRGCTNVEISGLTLKDSGGDGVCLRSPLEGAGYCENILITDVICDNNRRDGISVISAKTVTIEDCILKNSNGTPMEAGIDLEPHLSSDIVTNIVMRNCQVEDNKQYGILISFPNNNATGNISMLFEDCYVTGGDHGVRVSYLETNNASWDPDGSIEFKNITVENSVKIGAWIYDKSSEAASVSFTNCLWQNIIGEKPNPNAEYRTPIYILAGNSRTKPLTKAGGVEFIDCQVYDDIDRPAIVFKYTSQGDFDDLYEVNGDLYVINLNRSDEDGLHDWNGAELHDCDIEVHRGVADFCKAFDVQDSSGGPAGLFDIVGNLVLEGTLTKEVDPLEEDPDHDEFRFQDASGDDLMIICASGANSGDMAIAGTLHDDQTALDPQGDHNFIIKNWWDDIVAYIDGEDGDLYLKGKLYENAYTDPG